MLVGAYYSHHCACLVIDFGTATTFDVISSKGEFMGGAIAPGIGISAECYLIVLLNYLK